MFRRSQELSRVERGLDGQARFERAGPELASDRRHAAGAERGPVQMRPGQRYGREKRRHTSAVRHGVRVFRGERRQGVLEILRSVSADETVA